VLPALRGKPGLREAVRPDPAIIAVLQPVGRYLSPIRDKSPLQQASETGFLSALSFNFLYGRKK
jgi:hypothetical protein